MDSSVENGSSAEVGENALQGADRNLLCSSRTVECATIDGAICVLRIAPKARRNSSPLNSLHHCGFRRWIVLLGPFRMRAYDLVRIALVVAGSLLRLEAMDISQKALNAASRGSSVGEVKNVRYLFRVLRVEVRHGKRLVR